MALAALLGENGRPSFLDILDAIKNRRSIAKLTEEAVSHQHIEKIMEAGTFAPTHKRSDPWRFLVFSGEGRRALATAILSGFQKNNPDAPAEKLEKIAQKPYRAPAVILVWCAATRANKKIPLWEEKAAVAACLQNMSLAAYGFELGAIWRTGALVDYPQVQALCKTKNDAFDKDKGDCIIGLLYVGYPDKHYPKPTRSPAAAQVRYIE